MADYQDVAVIAIGLAEEMVDLLPPKHKMTYSLRLAEVRGAQATLAKGRITVLGDPGAGARAYWNRRRAAQQYRVETHNDGCDFVITGTDKLLEYLGWKPNTLSQRLSVGGGVLHLQKEIDGRVDVVTVTRMPNN